MASPSATQISTVEFLSTSPDTGKQCKTRFEQLNFNELVLDSVPGNIHTIHFGRINDVGDAQDLWNWLRNNAGFLEVLCEINFTQRLHESPFITHFDTQLRSLNLDYEMSNHTSASFTLHEAHISGSSSHVFRTLIPYFNGGGN